VPPTQNALQKWQKENPELAADCLRADGILEAAQSGLVKRMTEDITPDIGDSDFMLDEFLETWGRRMTHFNMLRHVLLVLGTPNGQAGTPGR